MTDYHPQVSRDHYDGGAYRFQDRWNSYWHQLQLVDCLGPQTVLEIGPGSGTVTRELRGRGIQVTTLDIAPDLAPDLLGSVTRIPLTDNSVDIVLAAEILEHIRYEDVDTAFREIARVARIGAVISLPHPGYVFSLILKVPLVRRMEIFLQIPFFWKKHYFNGEHYWELGKKGYPPRRFINDATCAGLSLMRMEKFADDPAHRFFLFAKKS